MHGFFFNPPIEANYMGHQMAEIYRDQIYAPLVSGKMDMIIVDIGANIGLASYYFSQFAKQVYAVEPALEHFDLLARMVTFNELTNVKPIKKAIDIKDGSGTLFHNKNKTMYSLSDAVNDGSSKPESVELITLDRLFREEKIKKCDLLKIDIEGTETALLSSAGFRKVAPKVEAVILETHQWNQRHPNQLRTALKSNGFEIKTVPADANIIVGLK